MAFSVSFDASLRSPPLPEESSSPDRKRRGESSLVAGAGVFGVAAGSAASVESELDPEVFGLRIRGRLGLDDNLITFTFGQRGGGDEEVTFLLEGELGLAAGSLGGGGDDFGARGLRFHRLVVDGDADGAIFLDEELGVFTR